VRVKAFLKIEGRTVAMITGGHIVIYTKDPDADRAFFKDVLQLPFVDAGYDWLIFALPAAEVAFHPDEQNNRHEMYFVCNNLKAQIAALEKKGVRFADVTEERWGTRTAISLPGGGQIGLYEPKHPVTFPKPAKPRKTAKSKLAKRH
jgi:catechol 2,3-dioxygenase-like lactoylglutathione lyase family enzyme